MGAVAKRSVTVCGIVRDEGPYLLEWIAWYKLLGCERVVIYDNDSQDDTNRLLPALHQAGEIVLRAWPNRAGQQPQLPAYRDAIARCSTEWIAFLDADEFLVAHSAPHLPDLLEPLPDDCSAIAFNQRFFGSSGQQHFDDRLVTERFVRSSAQDHPLNAWIKTVARTGRIRDIINPHSCELSSGYYAEPGGRRCVVQDQSFAPVISLNAGQYNHYILKSREEYLKKRARGRADTAADDPARLDKYTDEFFTLHDENGYEDGSAARKASLVRAERERLRNICQA
jgi:hypothetical protein